MKENAPNNYDPKFMQRAVSLSQIAYESGKGLPIGCVIVRNGEIIGEGHNEIFVRNNPTSHGEMVAIEDACKNIGNLQLEDCELYTTLEPCPMCFGAIYWAKLSKIYYANSNEDAAQAGFDDCFIFEEMQLPPEKRKIPMYGTDNTEAMKVLLDWKSQNTSACQPWTEKKEG